MRKSSAPSANVVPLTQRKVLRSRAPIDYFSAPTSTVDDEHDDLARPPKVGQWVTSVAAQWLNSLCPVVEPDFPILKDVPDYMQTEVREQFEFAYRRTRDEIDNLKFYAQIALTSRERAVWMTVERKTLAFGKFAEKLPRRKFTHGEPGKFNMRGMPSLPPCGVDDRRLDETFRGLIAVGWLSRFRSDPRRGGDASYVYLPFAAPWLIGRFFEHARYAAGRGRRRKSANDTRVGEELAELYLEATRRCCAEFFVSTPKGAAPAPVITSAEAQAFRRAVDVARRGDPQSSAAGTPAQPVAIRQRSRPTQTHAATFR